MKIPPPYRRSDGTQRVPRLVNARWLQRALRDNARAARAGAVLPWNAIDLYTRTAALIEQLMLRRFL